MLLRNLLLLAFCFIFSSSAFAEFYARVTAVDVQGNCTFITIEVKYDNGDPDKENPTVGSTVLADCGGLSGPDLGDTPQNAMDIELGQNPVRDNRVTVDYKGNEFSRGYVKAVSGPQQKSLNEQGLDYKGKERIDLSDLDPGWYIIYFQTKGEGSAYETFRIE
jgi:hypothetical protein